MKVFISYHRSDTKYRHKIENILKDAEINYYAVPEEIIFDGKSHQYIKDIILQGMKDCDILLCIIGKETYARPHVDWELHEALKGDMKTRKGILAVMLENRGDSKNNIDYETFPNRLQDNEDYIVIEQYASLHNRLIKALNNALYKSSDRSVQVRNNRKLMLLRGGKYYDVN